MCLNQAQNYGRSKQELARVRLWLGFCWVGRPRVNLSTLANRLSRLEGRGRISCHCFRVRADRIRQDIHHGGVPLRAQQQKLEHFSTPNWPKSHLDQSGTPGQRRNNSKSHSGPFWSGEAKKGEFRQQNQRQNAIHSTVQWEDFWFAQLDCDQGDHGKVAPKRRPWPKTENKCCDRWGHHWQCVLVWVRVSWGCLQILLERAAK